MWVVWDAHGCCFVDLTPIFLILFICFSSQSIAFKAREAAKREATETAKQYNYNYGDGGIVEETQAEFKTMGNNIKAAKQEAVDTAKKYNYHYTGV